MDACHVLRTAVQVEGEKETCACQEALLWRHHSRRVAEEREHGEENRLPRKRVLELVSHRAVETFEPLMSHGQVRVLESVPPTHCVKDVSGVLRSATLRIYLQEKNCEFGVEERSVRCLEAGIC